MSLALVYVTALSICLQITSMGLVGAYALQKRLSFTSQLGLVMTAYVLYSWVSRSSVLDQLYPRCGM